jgi:hypothetical protein
MLPSIQSTIYQLLNSDSEITDEDTPVTIDVLINDDFGGDGPSASSITVTPVLKAPTEQQRKRRR